MPPRKPDIKRTIENFINVNSQAEHHEAEDDNSILNKLLLEISKTSPTKQMIIGVSTGWVGGFLAMRIGKTTALALGGGIILLQVANEKGYININWNEINRDITQVSDRVEKVIEKTKMTWLDKAAKFFQKNTAFSSGLVAGFLIGTASR